MNENEPVKITNTKAGKRQHVLSFIAIFLGLGLIAFSVCSVLEVPLFGSGQIMVLLILALVLSIGWRRLGGIASAQDAPSMTPVTATARAIFGGVSFVCGMVMAVSFFAAYATREGVGFFAIGFLAVLPTLGCALIGLARRENPKWPAAIGGLTGATPVAFFVLALIYNSFLHPFLERAWYWFLHDPPPTHASTNPLPTLAAPSEIAPSEAETVLWDAASGKAVCSLREREWPVTTAAFSADGALLLTGNKSRTLTLWNPAAGATMRKFTTVGPATTLTFEGDGRGFLACSGRVLLLDSQTGGIIRSFDSNWHPDSAWLVCDGRKVFSSGILPSGHRGLKVWDFASGKKGQTFEEIKWSGYDYVMLAADGAERSWWHMRTGAPAPKQFKKFYGNESFQSLATPTPDGAKVLTRDNRSGAGRLWDLETGKLLWCSTNFGGGHAEQQCQTVFSSDGTKILAGGRQGWRPIVRRRDRRADQDARGGGVILRLAPSPFARWPARRHLDR